jgi:glycosyltransferase involved in cell wall biosynthesis
MSYSGETLLPRWEAGLKTSIKLFDMPEISAVIITLNEERNIERCLASLKRVADEIVVVDSFSTDRTAELCEKYNVRLIRNKFEGYIQQKNFAIAQSKFPVVLSLDADEALSGQLVESILRVKKNWEYDGYKCNRINNYCGKWIKYTSWYPDRKLRLWDKSKGSWEGLNPHDMVKMRKGYSISTLRGNIEHYSYNSISEHIAQVNRFTDISARSYYMSGVKSGYLKILFSPMWKFFRELIIKRGILDGYYGVIISIILSFETFLKYVKLRHLYRKP